MEQNPQYVAAIDVGTTKIVTLVGKRTNNKLEIVGFTHSESKGIRRGEVLNPETAAVVIRQTTEDLQKKLNITLSEVFVGIVGQHIRFQKSREQLTRSAYEQSITQSDLQQLQKNAESIAIQQGEEILHVLPQNYIVDGETGIINPIGMFGKRLEANFNIVLCKSDAIYRMHQCLNRAGLKIKSLILEPLASSDAVLFPEEREAGVMLVDIGGGTTDIAVFHDDLLCYSAVIPFGGNVITSDIKQACGLTDKEAEYIKTNYGLAMSEGAKDMQIVIPATVPGREPKEITVFHLAEIISARMTEIIDCVAFHLEQSGCKDKLGAGIVITGGGAMLQRVKMLFQFQTGMEVRIGYSSDHLVGSDESRESIRDTRYATGVGLLMKGLEFMDAHPQAAAMPQTPEEKPEEKPEASKPAAKKKKSTILEALAKSINAAGKGMEKFFEEPETKMA